MSKSLLNVLKCNIKLSVCKMRKLQKYKAALRKVAEMHVSHSRKKWLTIQLEGFLLPLLYCARFCQRSPASSLCPPHVHERNILRKIYVVSAHHYKCRNKRRRPLSSPRERKKKLRDRHHSFEKWIKMRHKFREADIRRKTQKQAISNFLRRVMPDTTTTTPNMVPPHPASPG